ncbi:hypothetical protein L914_03145, partial [Phytophthora nicotianae]
IRKGFSGDTSDTWSRAQAPCPLQRCLYQLRQALQVAVHQLFSVACAPLFRATSALRSFAAYH